MLPAYRPPVPRPPATGHQLPLLLKAEIINQKPLGSNQKPLGSHLDIQQLLYSPAANRNQKLPSEIGGPLE